MGAHWLLSEYILLFMVPVHLYTGTPLYSAKTLPTTPLRRSLEWVDLKVQFGTENPKLKLDIQISQPAACPTAGCQIRILIFHTGFPASPLVVLPQIQKLEFGIWSTNQGKCSGQRPWIRNLEFRGPGVPQNGQAAGLSLQNRESVFRMYFF